MTTKTSPTQEQVQTRLDWAAGNATRMFDLTESEFNEFMRNEQIRWINYCQKRNWDHALIDSRIFASVA